MKEINELASKLFDLLHSTGCYEWSMEDSETGGVITYLSVSAIEDLEDGIEDDEDDD